MSYRGLRARRPSELPSAEAVRRAEKARLAVYITVCALPALLTGLYYALRLFPGVMEWASTRVAAPIRGALGFASQIYPLSLMEILVAAAAVWVIFYIARSIMVTARRRGKLKILAKRLLTLVVVALYAWGLFCWLWNVGYYAPGFAEKNGIVSGGVAAADLAAVTALFARNANEFAPLVKRDADGHFIEDRANFFDESTSIYESMFVEFPCLSGRLYKPKSMLFSWLMSRTGYTGVYFALTGESNVNTNAPLALMPSTVAHELAHQRGVYAEDEANFVGVAACLSSGNPVFEYSGWLMGLIYLCNALSYADYDAWVEITGGLSGEVRRDWEDNNIYWASQRTVDTGIAFLDRLLTSTTGAVSDAVDSIYDTYLRAQNQELGLRSYGACVDLLVEYYKES